MKKTTTYIAAALMGAMSLSGCNDNFELPPMVYPTSNLKANTTIAQLKTEYWSTERNYVKEAGLAANGEHLVVKGRVISESASGNIYNSIVIQDETGALNIAVRTNKLEQSYLFGQEILVDVTALKIGGYNGLMQLGAEGTYNGAPSMTFMESAIFEEHAELNGAPQASKCDTVVATLDEIEAAKANQEGLIKMQSQLVRIENLTFEEPGQPFATDQNTNRYAKDANGKRINVRTSSYATFKNDLVPAGTGNVTGILSYYGSDWQLLLNDISGVSGFTPAEPGEKPDQPDQPAGSGDGTEANPFTVAQVKAGATGTEVWTKGYIVGWEEGQTLSTGAKFNAQATVQSNVLIADSKDAADVAVCVPVQLPAGAVRSALNLQSNPGNLGKEVLLKGNLEKYFGTAGIKTVTDYKIDGQGGEPAGPVEAVVSIDQNFDASTSLPAGWSQVQVSGDKTWYVTTFQENNYAAMTGYKGTKPPFDQWLLTPPVDMSKATDKVLSFRTQFAPYGSKTSVFEVYVLNDADPAKATVKDKLSPKLPTSATSTYSDWVESGELDLSKYTGTVYVAFRYYATQDANYATWCVDNVKVNKK